MAYHLPSSLPMRTSPLEDQSREANGIVNVAVLALNPMVDIRGSLCEVHRDEWRAGPRPVQWDFLISDSNVLRGVHVHVLRWDYIIVLDGYGTIGLKDLRRDQALQRARGRFVAYLGDDDAWMPDHLDVLDALLANADFGHTMQVGIDAQGQVVVMAADLQNAAFRNRMVTELFNRFDLTFAGQARPGRDGRVPGRSLAQDCGALRN